MTEYPHEITISVRTSPLPKGTHAELEQLLESNKPIKQLLPASKPAPKDPLPALPNRGYDVQADTLRAD